MHSFTCICIDMPLIRSSYGHAWLVWIHWASSLNGFPLPFVSNHNDETLQGKSLAGEKHTPRLDQLGHGGSQKVLEQHQMAVSLGTNIYKYQRSITEPMSKFDNTH